jgi:hypothetical protein
LPVPKPERDSSEFRELASLARKLEQTGIESSPDAYARLNAIAAHLYGLTRSQYEHIVSTFPLLVPELRASCVHSYVRNTEARRHGGQEVGDGTTL